jgi:soluble lytic murein transglycosylase-like protein
MSDGSVFESIENVLLRIDEIKRRFGIRRTDWEVERSPSFQKTLEEKSATAEEPHTSNAGEPEDQGPYADIIKTASQLYRIPETLIQAVIKQESNFEHTALSEKGAMGLMQLMPDTAHELGVEDPYDVEQNIFGGTHYLSDMIDLYEGNLNRALAAYNAGPYRVRERIPDIQETKNFIDSVLQHYNAFSKYSKGEVE